MTTLSKIEGGRERNPPEDDEMAERIARLETRLDTVLPTLATKGDVSEAKAAIVMWVAMAALAVVAIIVSVTAFMLNRAIPSQSAAPIIIYPQQAASTQQPSPPVSQSPPASKPGQKP